METPALLLHCVYPQLLLCYQRSASHPKGRLEAAHTRANTGAADVYATELALDFFPALEGVLQWDYAPHRVVTGSVETRRVIRVEWKGLCKWQCGSVVLELVEEPGDRAAIVLDHLFPNALHILEQRTRLRDNWRLRGYDDLFLTISDNNMRVTTKPNMPLWGVVVQATTGFTMGVHEWTVHILGECCGLLVGVYQQSLRSQWKKLRQVDVFELAARRGVTGARQGPIDETTTLGRLFMDLDTGEIRTGQTDNPKLLPGYLAGMQVRVRLILNGANPAVQFGSNGEVWTQPIPCMGEPSVDGTVWFPTFHVREKADFFVTIP